jgi:hypothetical protein
MELKTGHPRHLNVCNHAGHLAAASGFEKIIGAFKCHRDIAQRPDKARQSLSHRLIVVDDRYHGFPWQSRSLIEPEILRRMGFRHCTSVGSSR